MYSNQEQKIIVQCARNTLFPRPEKKDNMMYGTVTGTDEINIPVPVGTVPVPIRVFFWKSRIQIILNVEDLNPLVWKKYVQKI